MSIVAISTSGLLSQSISQLRRGQDTLATLSEQLASGVKSKDFTDFGAALTRQIVDMGSEIAKRESYIAAIKTVQPRVELYDRILGELEEITNQTLRLVTGTQNFDQAQNQQIGAQIEDFMNRVEGFLNERWGDRYLFSGSRLNVPPVGDINTLTALPVPPAGQPYEVTSPTLPAYDTAAPGTDANAYTRATITIDDGLTITYGVTSAATGIQQLIAGLRLVQAATNDATNYQAFADAARTALNNAVTNVRDVRGDVLAATANMTNVQDYHQSLIRSLNDQTTDIVQVDSNEVAAKLTFFQNQLQASYSATAIIAQLSITRFL